MKLKFIAALSAAVCILGLCLFSGCKASCQFALNTDEEGNKYYIVSCSGFSKSLTGEYTIPAYYGEGEDRAPVTTIASDGFAGSGLTKITVPNTITEIGNMAFAYSYSLKSVVFEEGSSLEELNPGMFIGCSALTEVVLPSSLKVINNSAFESCESLTSLNLPDNLERIGPSVFRRCSALEDIGLPASLISIGEQAFYCSGLKRVIIPDSVRDTVVTTTDENGEEIYTVTPAIGNCAFHSCTSMTLAVVGARVTTITEGAFGYCTSLKQLYLPASLEKVEGALYKDGDLFCGHAFHNNTSLTEVYFGGTAEMWEALKANINSTPASVRDTTFDNSALLNAKPKFGVAYTE